MRWCLVCACLALSAVNPPADVARDIGRAFRSTRKPADFQQQREAALNAAQQVDEPRVAAALLKAYATLEDELIPLEEQQRKYVLHGRRDKRLEKRPGVDPLRSLQDQILELVSQLKSPESLAPLVLQAVGDGRLPMNLRLAVAQRAEVLSAEPDRALLKALGKARKPGDQLVSLTCAAALGPAAEPAEERVVRALDSELATVREAAAAALASMGSSAGIRPMIALLAHERGRTKARLTSSLQVLTGQKISGSAAAWENWLEQEGAASLAGKRPLGKGEPFASKAEQTGSYHGLPLTGDSLLFVLDISNSMNRTLDKPSRKPKEGEESRMGRAMEELKHALGQLPASKRFNIIAFAGRLELFQESPVPVDEKHLALARSWIDARQMHLGTRIHDALELAFHLAGRASADGFYDSSIETLFLLTDGQPIAAGKADSQKAIRGAARRWNMAGRVVIHTIGLGDQVPKRFLREMARENGGEFVHEVSGGD